MNKEKVKKFWEENKTEIIAATVGVAVGVVLMKPSIPKYAKPKLNFGANNNAAAKVITAVSKNSGFHDFGWDLGTMIGDLGKYGEHLIDIYPELTKDTVVNGILVMTEK